MIGLVIIFKTRITGVVNDIFEKIVRPDYRTSVDEIRKGFINLNNSNYKGKIWIEIFILENINDSEENFIEIANFLNSENIRYDKIQLNTIDRVGAERDLKAISFDKILKAKKILEENGLHDVEIIKSLSELEENQKIQINKELLDNMKQKRLYQEEEINKIFKKS